LQQLYRDYGTDAEFLLVVVTEAGHRIKGLEFLLDADGARQDRRDRVARAVRQLGVLIPTVLDKPSSDVETAYAAFPMRIVVVNRDGNVVARPQDADELGVWLTQNLGGGRALRLGRR
jgi:hypothetical protein